MAKPPTVEDVARVAGVSRQTVSNVLNSPGIVREETRERVQRAIVELAYRPHAAARQLRTRRSSTIGIHLDPYAGGISGVLLDRFVHALTERASERGMRMLIYSARSAERGDRAPRRPRRRGRDRRRRGDRHVLRRPAHGLAARARRAVRVVRPPVGRRRRLPTPRTPGSMSTEPPAPARRRVTLLATAGPRVGFFGWPGGSGTGDDRERGWREAMADAGAAGPRFEAVDGLALARELMSAAFAEPDVLRRPGRAWCA